MTRILHITRNLPPLVGGMERLNWHIADELAHAAAVTLIGPKGSAATRPPNVEVREVPLEPLRRFLLGSAWEGVRTARKIRPDIVLAGSGVTAPAAWAAARSVGARAGVYLHGLDAAVRHPLYRAVWHPILRRMDFVLVNSHPTERLARENVGVAAEKITVIYPGVAVASTAQPDAALREFRLKYDLGDAEILLSVGRLTTRKGLREFVEHGLPMI